MYFSSEGIDMSLALRVISMRNSDFYNLAYGQDAQCHDP